ncbi:hypothetical protein [Tautonia marina]|uniref:hypothetical protein n=1 Tax=Tautonia marina TaxID=2653855 RepID=UPI001260D1C6|nr:hypothetical protein [Tautonia marina]
MAVRILHCGKSLLNYNLCLSEKVFGFTRRGQQLGDTVYLVVKHDGATVCGMRAKLADVTDARPWPDAEHYVVGYTLEDVSYSEPFEIQFLAAIGGEHWALRYLQGARPIQEAEAADQLAKAFEAHRSAGPIRLGVDEPSTPQDAYDESDKASPIENVSSDDPEGEGAVSDTKIKVLGTFQTIRFRNEKDLLQGLEPLVTEHFYSLLPAYREEHSLLIPDNRLFQSAGVEARGDSFIKGIRSIPDALLIVYNKQLKNPIQINLIEYECFGEGKVSSQEKSNYLNSHVIPQLMRFASTFSIVTDKQIRDQTIRDWTDKVIAFIFSDPDRMRKLSSWIKEIDPGIAEQLIGRQIDKHITNAFQKTIKVMLVVDELSTDQRDTISNVISAFKLENGESIRFLSYIVRLHQRIAITDERAEYALSVQ